MDFTIAVHPVEQVVRGGGEEGSEVDVVVLVAAGSVRISRSDVLLVVTPPLEEWKECFGCVILVSETHAEMGNNDDSKQPTNIMTQENEHIPVGTFGMMNPRKKTDKTYHR
jgi:hypothetical protein